MHKNHLGSWFKKANTGLLSESPDSLSDGVAGSGGKDLYFEKSYVKFNVGGPRTTLRFVARWLEDGQIIEVKKSYILFFLRFPLPLKLVLFPCSYTILKHFSPGT